MQIESIHSFLTHYHETVAGLRTGHYNKANVHFAQLADTLNGVLESAAMRSSGALLEVVQRMLTARERNDNTALADSLEYELIDAMDDPSIRRPLMSVETLGWIKQVADRLDTASAMEPAVSSLQRIMQSHPAACGVMLLPALQLCACGRGDDAARLLELEKNEERQTPASAYLFGLLSAHQSDAESACRNMEWAYQHDDGLSDGFISIANLFANLGESETAEAIAQRETRFKLHNRIPVALLIARTGDFAKAESMVEAEYASNSSLCDGYLQLAGLHAEKFNWHQAADLAVRDESAHRLTAGGKVRLARIQGELGNIDHAVRLLEAASSEDATLTGGFADLAWICARRCDWATADRLMTQAASHGELSDAAKTQQIVIKMYTGYRSEAITLVEQRYREDRSANDLFSQVGWHAYLLTQDRAELRRFIDRDVDAGRVSTVGRLHQAVYAILAGSEVSQAQDIAHHVSRHPGIRNWLSLIGWAHYLAGSREDAIAYMSRDYHADRMDASWVATYAILHADNGNRDAAKEIVDQLVDQRPDIQLHKFGFWTRPEHSYSTSSLYQRIGAD